MAWGRQERITLKVAAGRKRPRITKTTTVARSSGPFWTLCRPAEPGMEVITSRFGPWTIWPLDDLAHPLSIWPSQSVDLAHLIYFGFAIILFIFPAITISIIIRRGFERFLVQKISRPSWCVAACCTSQNNT